MTVTGRAGREDAPDEPYEPDPRRWRALSVALVAGFMSLLDVSIVNLAIPSIRDGLGATAAEIQWVLSGYTLAFGLTLVPAGRLGDARGRRTVFLSGLALFTLGSLACGLAPNPVLLVVGRLVQGFGGGVLAPQVSALIQTLFRGAERGRAFGIFGMTVGLSTAVGPLLGGVILTTVPGDGAWRWVFLVNLPVGVLAFVLGMRLVPPGLGAGRREPLDPVGVVLLAAALLLLLLPLLESSSGLPPLLWLSLPLGLAGLGAFVWWERRYAAHGRPPLVDLRLLRERSYAYGLCIGLAYFAGFTSVFFTLSLLLQSGLGYSPLAAGLTTAPFAIGGAVSAPLAGRVITRVGRAMVAYGLGLVLVGLAGVWVVVRIEAAPLGAWLVVPLLVGGVGSGLVISPNVTLTLTDVPVAEAGSAGGVLQTAQRIGASIGVAVVGAAFFAALGDELDWRRAFEVGLLLILGLVAVSLAVALADLRASRVAAQR